MRQKLHCLTAWSYAAALDPYGGPGDAGCPAWFGVADCSALPVELEGSRIPRPRQVSVQQLPGADFSAAGPERRWRAGLGVFIPSVPIARGLIANYDYRSPGLPGTRSWESTGVAYPARSSASPRPGFCRTGSIGFHARLHRPRAVEQ